MAPGAFPALTVAVLNQKGGVGKTTLALHLAAAWSLVAPRLSIALLDLDDQESLARYKKAARGTALRRAHFEAGSWRDLPDLLALPKIAAADVVVIDCPRSLDDALTRAILGRCDAALVPFQPEYDALIATVRTLKVADSIPNLRVKVALNGTTNQRHRVAIRRDARESLGTTLCAAPIPQHGAFGEAAIASKTVFDTVPDGALAGALLRLAGEVGREWGVLGAKTNQL